MKQWRSWLQHELDTNDNYRDYRAPERLDIFVFELSVLDVEDAIRLFFSAMKGLDLDFLHLAEFSIT